MSEEDINEFAQRENEILKKKMTYQVYCMIHNID